MALLTASSAGAQSIEAKRMYTGAKPYMYEPLATLKNDVHDLSGLKPDANQDGLEELLQEASAVIVAQMPRIPNLIAHEEIAREQRLAPSYSPGAALSGRRRQDQSVSAPAGIQDDRLVPQEWRRFEYVILAKPYADGVLFDESRSEIGKQRGQTQPQGTGFGALWMMFLPAKLPESHFRYLGKQKVDGRPTLVVAFAQDPELVKMPGVIKLENAEVPLLYQGVAWIDEESFRMIRIRTDLLAPLPQFQIQRVTSSVNFIKVLIPQLETPLWLPKDVEITWEIAANRLGELHRYSGYHLFRATSRIVPD